MPVLVQQAWVSPVKCSEDTGFVCFQQKRIAIIHDISAHHRPLQDDSETFDVQRPWSQVEATSNLFAEGRELLLPHPHTDPQSVCNICLFLCGEKSEGT